MKLRNSYLRSIDCKLVQLLLRSLAEPHYSRGERSQQRQETWTPTAVRHSGEFISVGAAVTAVRLGANRLRHVRFAPGLLLRVDTLVEMR